MGDVSEEECARLEEHLLICPACRRRVAEHDVFLASMRLAARSLRREAQPAKRASFWVATRMIAVFGTVTVLASLAFLITPDAVHPARQSAAVAVDLAATRGAFQVKAPAGRVLQLKCDLTGLPGFPSYRLDVVDNSGRRVRQAQTASTAQVDGLPSGIYFIRIYAPTGELLREYGLEVGAS